MIVSALIFLSTHLFAGKDEISLCTYLQDIHETLTWVLGEKCTALAVDNLFDDR